MDNNKGYGYGSGWSSKTTGEKNATDKTCSKESSSHQGNIGSGGYTISGMSREEKNKNEYKSFYSNLGGKKSGCPSDSDFECGVNQNDWLNYFKNKKSDQVNPNDDKTKDRFIFTGFSNFEIQK